MRNCLTIDGPFGLPKNKSMEKKYLVYMRNDFTLLKNEYFGKGQDCVIGYHDPRKADTFSTKKAAQEFASTFNMETMIDTLDKHIDLFLNADYVYRQIPLIDSSLNQKYAGETADGVLNWWLRYAKLPEGSVTYDVYRTWPSLFAVCKHIHSHSVYRSNKESFITFQLFASEDSKFKDFEKEVKKVLEHVTLLQDGYKKFSIFDHELSEFETRYFLHKNDQDCRIMGFMGRVLKSGSMEECFNTIKTDYYYNYS